MYKLFKQTNINLKNTILFSLAVGLFCGVFGGLPILKDTSFTDMAGGYEWWVVFAVIICANSKKFYMAGLYCGLFFLITQPLQFFIQALLYSHNFTNALYYFKLWLPVIIATIPGGMIAYFVSKDNLFGSIVLGLGNGIQAIMFYSYLQLLIQSFPRHLIATVFSLLSIIVMSFIYQKQLKYRIISLLIPILCVLAIPLLQSII